MQPVTIDIAELGVHEAGATVLGHLAFPAPTDAAQRELFIAACCQDAYRRQAHRDAEWANSYQLLKPAHALLKPEAFRRGIRTSERRLRDREVAGRMAIAFLIEPVTGNEPALPASMKRLSLNALAELHLELAGETEVPNVIKRAWASSRPVVHLAAALEIYQRQAEDTGAPGFKHDIIFLLPALKTVVEMSAHHRSLIANIPKLGISEAELLEIRLIG